MGMCVDVCVYVHVLCMDEYVWICVWMCVGEYVHVLCMNECVWMCVWI